MQTRRNFIKRAGLAGAGLALMKFGPSPLFAAGNSTNLLKWTHPIRGLGPSGIPVLSGVPDPVFANTTMYRVTAGEFTDQLHPDLPPTRLWGYWDTTNPVQRHLGGVVISPRGTAARLRVTNTLPPDHIIPVDTGLPGANQAQNRIAVHLHGGFIPWLTDGGPFDWWTPEGVSGLSFLNGPGGVLDNIPGAPMLPGQADYFYGNDQSTRLMWYHDHAHGITRINAYAGLATGYLVVDAINDAYVAAGKIPGLASTIPLVFQDKVFVNPATMFGPGGSDPTWTEVTPSRVHGAGSLWYEHIYDPNVFMLNPPADPPNPSAIPEFFGDTMLCNGTVYPYVPVEAKRYRFMILNACNARFLNINLFRAKPKSPDGINLDPLTQFPMNPPGPKIFQIGTEGGFLQQEVTWISPKPFNPLTLQGNLILGPAERADIIIDFSKNAGDEIIMYNDAPGPFPGGAPDTDYYLGNPLNPIQPLPGTGPDTRQILRFRVAPATTPDPQPKGPILDPMLVDPPLFVAPPKGVVPVPPLPIPAGVPIRELSLNEDFDSHGRLAQLLGTLVPKEPGAASLGRDYLDPATEVIPAGSTEVWRIWNFSADTHPVHFHLVNVQVLQRQPFVGDGLTTPVALAGLPRGPELNELGWKETVQMHPGEAITLIMKFDLPAAPALIGGGSLEIPESPRTGGHEYVWHCHILEHEEHDMMRPLVVT